MEEISERGCSVHYFQPSNDCINCEIKRTNDKIRKLNLEKKNPQNDGNPNLIKCLTCEVKISPKKKYCKSCKRTNDKKTKHFSPMKIERRIAKVEQKKNKPVVTRDLFGREHTYPVEQKYNICKKCKARFKPRKVGLISRIGISVLGVFAIGPLGVFAGGVAEGLEADRDLCDECNYSAPE